MLEARELIEKNLPPLADLLEAETVARLINVPVKTLANWRALKIELGYTKCGRHVRYPKSEVIDWLARNTTVIERPAC